MAETAADATERIQILLDLEKDAHDKAARASAREIAKLEKSYDPLSRATIRYKQETDKLTAALQKGTITEQRHAQLMDKVQSEYDQTTEKIIKQNAALAANQNAGGGVVGMLNRNKSAVQNLGYQVGDFAVQVGSGTSALTALAQQGSQVLGAFGAFGAIAGAALAILAPLAAAFMKGGEEAETLGKQIEALQDAVGDYVSAADNAQISTSELQAKYGTATDAARTFLDAIRGINQTLATESLDETFDRISESLGRLSEMRNVRGDIMLGAGVQALIDDYGVAYEKVQSVADALGDLGRAEGPQAQADAAAAFLQVLEAALGPYDQMNANARELYRSVAEAGDQAAVMQGEIEGAADEAYRFKTIVDELDLSGATGQAALLAEMMGVAASEAVRYNEALNTQAGIENPQRGLGFGMGSIEGQITGTGYSRLGFGNLDGRAPRTVTRPEKTKKTTSSAKSAASKAAKEIERAGDAYDSLIASLSPVEAANQKLAKSEEVIAEALQKRLITSEEAQVAYSRVNEEYLKSIQQIEDAGRTKAFEELRQDVEGLTESLLRTAAAGGSVGDALRSFLADAALQAAAQNLTSALFGASGTTGGGLFGSLASAIFGQRAGGGGARAGVPYLVNEGTPNSEVFVPSRSGGILNVPQAQAALAKSGGMLSSTTTITQPISIDARGAQAGVAEQIAQQIERMRPQMQADAVTAVYKANKERPLR